MENIRKKPANVKKVPDPTSFYTKGKRNVTCWLQNLSQQPEISENIRVQAGTLMSLSWKILLIPSLLIPLLIAPMAIF